MRILLILVAVGLLYNFFSDGKPADNDAHEAALYDRCAVYFDLAKKPRSQGGCRDVVPNDWLQRGWTMDDMTNALDACHSSHDLSQSDAQWCAMNDPRSVSYNTLRGR